MDIIVKRVYEPAAADDGYRVLVDRLWPRGIRKESLQLDEWAKSVTPSNELRTAWHSGAINTATFRVRYLCELSEKPSELSRLAHLANNSRLTLLVATREPTTSHAHVLAEAIRTLGTAEA